MENQLLAPCDLAPVLPRDISSVGAVHLWIDLMKTADKLVMAGLAHQVGEDRAEDAYRRWYRQQTERHGQHVAKLARALREAGKQYDGNGSCN